MAGMVNYDLMMDRGTDPLKSGSIGFSSQRSGKNHRQDYNPTKVGPQIFPSKFSQPGLMSNNSGLNNQILKPYGSSSLENQLKVGKSITLGMNDGLENQTTYHNTSLQQASNDLIGPSIESTIMAGIRQGSIGNSGIYSTNNGSPKPLGPKMPQRNVMYQKKGLAINQGGRNPFVLNTERSKLIDDYTSGIRGVGLNNTKLSKDSKLAERQRLDSSISVGITGKTHKDRNQITLNGSPDQSMMYQNKYNEKN